MQNCSLVRLLGAQSSHCGYCDQDDTSKSYGMWAVSLTCQDYQQLIDKGWRRSGHYLYKPNLESTCCPAYTIRLEVEKYQLSKSKKKVIQKWKQFQTNPKIEPMTVDQPASTIKIKEMPHIEFEQATVEFEPKVCQFSVDGNEKQPMDGMRQSNQRKKQAANSPVSLTQRLAQAESKLKVILTKAEFDQEAFEVYCKYQQVVHNDDPLDLTVEQYKRFLVNSPLQLKDGFGSFHQKYYFQDQLICVGVIDILPNCVSSVYFFYDPNYAFLSPGTYSALREIAYTIQLGLPFYYMGYYIHTCAKMTYKARYAPSYLLCPATFEWFGFDKVQHLLDEKPRLVFGTLQAYRQPDANKVDDKSLHPIVMYQGKLYRMKGEQLEQYKPLLKQFYSLLNDLQFANKFVHI